MTLTRDLGEDETGCIKMGFYNDGTMSYTATTVAGQLYSFLMVIKHFALKVRFIWFFVLVMGGSRPSREAPNYPY